MPSAISDSMSGAERLTVSVAVMRMKNQRVKALSEVWAHPEAPTIAVPLEGMTDDGCVLVSISLMHELLSRAGYSALPHRANVTVTTSEPVT